MSIRLNSSSRPGMTDSSSASTVSTPPQLSRLMTYSWISRQLASSRAWVSICSAHRRSLTWRGAAPSSTSSESASEWAGSVDITSVRWPRLAALAAATVVLPTPPLPVNRRMRTLAPGGGLPGRRPGSLLRLDTPLQVPESRAHDLPGRLPLDQPGQRHAELDLEPVGDQGAAAGGRLKGVGAGEVLQRPLHVLPGDPALP